MERELLALALAPRFTLPITLTPAERLRYTPLIRGDVAQLGERFVRNEEAVGSSPIFSTNQKPVTAGFFLSGLRCGLQPKTAICP